MYNIYVHVIKCFVQTEGWRTHVPRHPGCIRICISDRNLNLERWTLLKKKIMDLDLDLRGEIAYV